MKRVLKAAAKHAVPQLASMTHGRKKKMVMSAGKWAAGRVLRRKPRASMGTLALRGLGVAALAVPVGMWIGKMISESEEAGEG